jgi:hypothetical protein
VVVPYILEWSEYERMATTPKADLKQIFKEIPI